MAQHNGNVTLTTLIIIIIKFRSQMMEFNKRIYSYSLDQEFLC